MTIMLKAYSQDSYSGYLQLSFINYITTNCFHLASMLLKLLHCGFVKHYIKHIWSCLYGFYVTFLNSGTSITHPHFS